MDNRDARLEEEHPLLLELNPTIVRSSEWFLVPDDERARRHGWSPEPFPVAFHAQPGHPGQAPYGIYIASNATVGGVTPNPFQAVAKNTPPFPGSWGVLSWTPQSAWVAHEEVHKSSNLVNFYLGFDARYRAGVSGDA